MDAELKSYLEGINQRLGSFEDRFKSLEVRLDTMEKRFDTMEKRFDTMEKRFDTIDDRFEAMENRFFEALHDMETRLLSEFWKWSRTSDQRMRRIEHSDAATTERLTLIEERVFTLERKVAGSKES